MHRPTYSAEDMAARRWIGERMAEAGLAVEIDGIGNVIGRSPGEGPRLMIGSHSESQNHAGWLDGALGVMYGVEVARALKGEPALGGRNIDVICFADEEGHFSNFTGSRSFVGQLDEEEIERTRNRYDGTPLRTALERAGLAGRPRAQIDPARTSGFLEAHIEQGDYLESGGLRVGIVTSVVAIWQYRVVFEGEQNHAGTTAHGGAQGRRARARALCRGDRPAFPGGRRRAHGLDHRADHPRSRRAQHHPRPRRDAVPVPRRRSGGSRPTAADARGAGRRRRRRAPAACALEAVSRSVPKLMEPRLLDALEAAAEQHAPDAHMRMPSAAGHDAQIVAQRVPAAMLFVPSIGGISHHWTENTKDEDIVLGCQVMATAAARILGS